LVLCPRCGKTSRQGARFCRFCGSPLGGSTRIYRAEVSVAKIIGSCPWCNTPVSDNIAVCPICGAYRKEGDKSIWVKAECPFCNTPITKYDGLCQNCGAYRDVTDKKTWIKEACPFCDTPIAQYDNMCPNCGAYRDKKDPQKWIRKKRKWKLPFL